MPVHNIRTAILEPISGVRGVFFIWNGFRLRLLGASATSGPILPAPDDYECGVFGGMVIDRGIQSTPKTLLQCHFVCRVFYMARPGIEPGLLFFVVTFNVSELLNVHASFL
jgi:hypothetical protein